MKLRKKDIDKLIDILQKKKEELESKEDDYIFEFIGARERDDFILPDKWVVRGHKFDEVHNWFNSILKRIVSVGPSGAWFHHPETSGNICTRFLKEKDYIEITLEQFKKYVLNED